ncbi:MAG: type II secretion system protein M [Phycisphaerales bacterium]|nr:MAG: type II secretion system protein M [Phycisphaerales bacterium]
MTHREMWLAGGLGVFVIAWAIYAFGVSPVLERIETLNRVIPERQSELQHIRAKTDKYMALRAGIENLRTKVASQDQAFELLPLVESLIGECGLSGNLDSMNKQELELGTDYRETVVEVKMKRLTLPQIVDLLLRLRSSKVVTGIKRLYIKKNLTDASLLDPHLEISSLRLSGN